MGLRIGKLNHHNTSDKEFKRISPLDTGHINFLGKYIFEEERIETSNGLRPLIIKG
jgi:hypothetical protein